MISANIDCDYNGKCNDMTNDETRRKEELSHYVQNSGLLNFANPTVQKRVTKVRAMRGIIT